MCRALAKRKTFVEPKRSQNRSKTKSTFKTESVVCRKRLGVILDQFGSRLGNNCVFPIGFINISRKSTFLKKMAPKSFPGPKKEAKWEQKRSKQVIENMSAIFGPKSDGN